MKHVEAPPLTQRDLNAMLLYFIEKLGKSRGTVEVDDILDPMAAVACEANNIQHHHEVGSQYLRERVYRTVRDGIMPTNNNRRPCEMFLGESSTAPTQRRSEEQNIPIFIRCTDYRPFAQHHSREWDRKFKRSEKTYPTLIARLESLRSSIDGLFYCKVIGPMPYAFEEDLDAESSVDDMRESQGFQESLDFPSWNAQIVIPKRDVRITASVADNINQLLAKFHDAVTIHSTEEAIHERLS